MTSLDQSASDNSPARASQADRDAADAEATTAAWLLAGLASRLRTAYEQGADVRLLAEACRQPESEVRRLLELAGATEGRRPGGVPPAGVPGQGGGPTAPFTDWQDFRRIRRPTPSRRLSRLHPRSSPAPEPERAAPGPAVPVQRPGGNESGQPVESATAPAAAGTPAEVATTPPAAAPPAAGAAAQAQPHDQVSAPLGVLIGASPAYAEPPSALSSSGPRRVPVELVRLSPGTSLIVLPSWRAAIAVSVPTEQLLAETGLGFRDLPGARLTVLMNPDALHDRELDLRCWRTENGPAATGN